MRYFDFHTHILFAVDHGVQDLATYTMLVKEYAKQGFDSIMLTPHIYHPGVECKVENIRTNYEKAKAIAKDFGLDTYLGSELYVDGQLTLNSIPVAQKYALVEFPEFTKPVDLEGKLSQLTDNLLIPVIAHVERYQWLKPTGKTMEMLQRLGCLIQVNVHGIEKKVALPYMEAGVVDIIASDNHGDIKLIEKLRKTLDQYPEVLEKMQNLRLNRGGHR